MKKYILIVLTLLILTPFSVSADQACVDRVIQYVQSHCKCDVPTPPPVEPDGIFDGYRWEDSNNPKYSGQSYIMPPMSLKGKIKSIDVNGKPFRFVMYWKGGRGLWYGPGRSTFSDKTTITVLLKDGKKLINTSNIPPPSGNRVYGSYRGTHNVDHSNKKKPVFRWEHPGEYYPNGLLVKWEGGQKNIHDTGKFQPAYRGPGVHWNPHSGSDTPKWKGNLVIMLPSNFNGVTKCWLEW